MPARLDDEIDQGSSAGERRPGSGRRGSGAPSLDLRRESVPGLPPEICPKKPYWMTAREAPQLRFPASCDAYRCSWCGPRKAEQVAALMTWAVRRAGSEGSRARLVTLTNAPADWQARRKKVRVMAQWARRDLGVEWEVAWATERGSKTGMIHVHAVEHGKHKIPQAVLQDRWGAIVDIRAIRQPRAGVYAVKEALAVAGYTLKGATGDVERLNAHLELNGHRAAHMSRGFLHGLTKREALGELRRELAGGEDLTWGLVPAWNR